MLLGAAGSASNTNTNATGEEFNADVNFLSTIFKLQECIQQAITQLNYDTAVFLSELLYSECSVLDRGHSYRLESVYLYSLSLFLKTEYHTALNVCREFRNSSHAGIGYVFARCCLHLSTGLHDAVVTLLNLLKKRTIPPSSSMNALIFLPTMATVHCLLGKLYYKLDKSQESALHYSEALNADPYLWEAYVELCNMKATIDLKKLYNIMSRQDHFPASSARYKTRAGILKSTPYKIPNSSSSSASSSSSSTVFQHQQQQQQQQQQQHQQQLQPQQQQQSQAPQANSQNVSLAPPHTNAKGQPTNSLLNKANVVVSTLGFSPFSSKQSATNSVGKANNRGKVLTTPPSKLLSTTNFKTPRNNNLTNNYHNTNNNYSTSKKRTDPVSFSCLKQESSNGVLTSNLPTFTSLSSLHELMYNFARILKASSQYDSYKALRLMETQIPDYIKNEMPWCQACLGKLHFEIVNYEMSLKHFKQLRQMQPTRSQDIEVFSTLLWHMHDKVNLSHLSNELVEIKQDKPQTWCCLGNLYSLQRDHDEAIRYFEKATEVDPHFAYGYTLQGHEHSSNDSIDMAKTCYRKAIASDPQHYNAYYGLGMCCMKLGQYEEALLYFEKARSINPVNVILICCCGVALEKMSYQEKALQYYELASELQPSSSLAKFKKAHLLYVMARYSVALENFEELVQLAPDEATVHFLLGQLYQIMGRKKDAVKEFTVAMNLDPKGNQLIIDALEKCHMQE